MAGTTGQSPATDPHYDADAKANARLHRTYKIGGKLYLPVKKTGKVMKRVMHAQPQRPDDDVSTEASIEGLDSMYRQVAILLRPADATEDGASPLWAAREDSEIQALADEFEEHLDLEEARELIRELLPNTVEPTPTPAGASQPPAAS
jgi:hypothetical protein